MNLDEVSDGEKIIKNIEKLQREELFRKQAENILREKCSSIEHFT